MGVRGIKRYNIKELIEKIGEATIFHTYLRDFKKLKMPFSSPFRKDSEPSASVIVRDDGSLYYKDFGNDDRGGVIWLIMKVNNCSLYDVGMCLNRDFSLGNYKPINTIYSPTIKKYTHFDVELKRWNKKSLNYWKDFEFTIDDLEEGNIFNVNPAKIYINHQRILIPKDEIVYGYYFPEDEYYNEGWKILRPFANKKEKWRTNVPIYRVENLDRCNTDKPLLLAGCRKDRITLSKVIGWDRVANSQNESEDFLLQGKENIERLKRFPEVIIAWDSDAAGKKASQLVTEKYGYKHLNVPDKYLKRNIKDFSELVEYEGCSPLIKHLKNKKII